MSLYLDNKDAFLSPQVSQYGNHSIMTNIYKPTKKKFVNIDTRFQEEYNTSRLASVTCKIPQQIIDVKSIQICSMELPVFFYNFSKQRKNTFFVVQTTGNRYLVTIDDGQYTAESLLIEINSKLVYASLIDSPTVFDLSTIIRFSLNKNTIQLTNMGSSSLKILWGVSESGYFDKYQLKMKFGWCLGFREPEYVILPFNSASDEDVLVAESILDLYTFRYLYLVVDEFNQTNPNSFLTPSSSSFLSTNTLARISLDSSTSFGQVLSLNTRYGNIVSDIRMYSGKTDIQKLQLHIADEWGNLVDLNQSDFSFCLELQCE
jgi:hypothetical protein